MNNLIAAIGTINRDTIHLSSGEKYDSYGGLLYSIIALAQLTEDDYEILPVVNLGRDCSEAVMGMLKRYDKVKTSAISIVSAKNNHCNLYYLDRESKSEILKGGVPVLEYKDLLPALESDLTLVNFISGNDVSLDAIEEFRKDYGGKIYMDIHSLTLGKKENGERFMRRPVDWERYAACADYLQMNQKEFELLSETSATEENIKEFFHNFKELGWEALNVTLAELGSYLLYGDHGEVACHQLTAPRPERLADTTGCGDVFAAAFSAAVCMGFSSKLAAWTANQKASDNCRFAGIENLELEML